MNDAPVGVLEAPELIATPVKELPPSTVLVPRSDGAEELALALGAVRIIERDRRWTTAIGYMGGWLVAGFMAVPLIILSQAVSNQRPPEDKIWVAMLNSDGSVPNPAKPAQDQTPSEREATIRKFIYDYVDYRVSYDWDHLRYNYDWTRFTTVGDAQAEYIASMTTAPDRPTESMGKDGARQVTAKAANRVGSDAFEVVYRVKSKLKQGGWTPETSRRVRITYNVSNDMPAEVAARLDPLKLVVTRWSDGPAAYNPDVPGEAQ